MLYVPQHAVHFHNSSIQKDAATTPYESFTGETLPWSITDFRVFGSPTYVLTKELQDGTSFGKWKSRAWEGVYIGNSTCHASAIPLIYNPASTHISPQYHVVYDEYFHSIHGPRSVAPDAYLEKLFHSSACWFYENPYHDTPNFFESYWHHVGMTKPTCKRRLENLTDAPLGWSAPVSTPSLHDSHTSRDPSSALSLRDNTIPGAKITPQEEPSCGSTPAIPAFNIEGIHVAPAFTNFYLGIDVATQHSHTAGTRPQYGCIDNTSF